MAQKRKRQGGVSWELIGIVAVLGVFVVGILYWVAQGGSSGSAVTPPSEAALKPAPDITLESGMTDDGRPYVGKADAPVTVMEFADFQCPHCRDFSQIDAKAIKTDYVAKGVVKLVWVNFPFLGDESIQAARAATCAGEQGKFWEMHDWLFANQAAASNSGGFAPARLQEMAAGIGLDAEAFGACLDDEATAERVKADRQFGDENGVDSTPSFMIGDTMLKGATVQSLRDAIDAAAAQSGS